MSSHGGAQVPAWKRLGLKLKQPDAASGSSPTVGHPSSSTQQPQIKRKFNTPLATTNPFGGAKRPRTEDDGSTGGNGQLRKQKSVTFANSAQDAPSAARSTPQNQKKSKGPAKKQTLAATDITPALEYLRLWKTNRDSWKFNKNHQSSLIKNIFEPKQIPAADIDTFYDYIKDIKGFVKMRFCETAMEIRTQDQSLGPKGFPEGTKDAETTQTRYETILSRFIESQAVGSKRKAFSEPEYLASSEDGDVIIQRLVKRMRAELVLDVLSDGEETETTASSASSTITAPSQNNAAAAAASTSEEKQGKGNQAVGSKRRRKIRTNVSDSESSSDSDSSSDSSSDESDSDDDDDDEPAKKKVEADDDTSSSSSSSSDEADDDSDSSDSDSSDEEDDKKKKKKK